MVSMKPFQACHMLNISVHTMLLLMPYKQNAILSTSTIPSISTFLVKCPRTSTLDVCVAYFTFFSGKEPF